MDSNKDYNAIVNPTFETAKVASYLLSRSGEDNAVKFANLLGFTKNPFEAPGREASEDFLNLISANMETRYKSVNANLKESGLTNILDLACGYTPRVLDAMDMGVDYVGVDVPVVVGELTEKLGDVANGGKHPRYMAGDVTNAASLKKAADQLEGEIFISSEGLLGYLSEIELRELLKGIRQILLEHGGVWYTSEPTNFYGEAVPVVASNTDLLQELKGFTQILRSEKDIFIDSTDITDAEAVRKLFEECGFKVEKVPYYSEEFRVKILDSYPAELKERFLDLLNNMEGWKMTPVGEAIVEEGPAQSASADNPELKYQVAGNRLTLTPVGRIDTLSAPEFLKVYDESREKHNLAEVVVDATDLSYISSTGLRTLMIMVRDLGVGNVRLKNPQPMVVNILEDSGFANVVVIE